MSLLSMLRILYVVLKLCSPALILLYQEHGLRFNQAMLGWGQVTGASMIAKGGFKPRIRSVQLISLDSLPLGYCQRRYCLR